MDRDAVTTYYHARRAALEIAEKQTRTATHKAFLDGWCAGVLGVLEARREGRLDDEWERQVRGHIELQKKYS